MATNVYYSVGNNTSDHKSGSPTMTMSGGVATLSVDQSAVTNMGAGDRVTYDTSKVAYIASIISGTQFNLVTATGGTPSDEVSSVTVNSIAHEYSSTGAAESGATDANHLNSSDLTAATGIDVILNFVCYRDTGAYTSGATVNGYTTSATNYIHWYAPNNVNVDCFQSHRWAGIYDETKMHWKAVNTFCLSIQDDHVRVTGFQAYLTGDNDRNIFTYIGGGATSEVYFINCFARGPSSSATLRKRGFYMVNSSANGAKVYCINCVAYDFGNNSNAGGFVNISTNTLTSYIYNCVGRTSRVPFAVYGAGGSMICKNCFGTDQVGALDAYYESAGGFHADCTNNASNDASAPGSNTISLSSRTVTEYFESSTDYHIDPTATYADEILLAGTDLSGDSDYAFNTDIDGNTRPSNRWDVGIDQESEALAVNIITPLLVKPISAI